METGITACLEDDPDVTVSVIFKSLLDDVHKELVSSPPLSALICCEEFREKG